MFSDRAYQKLMELLNLSQTPPKEPALLTQTLSPKPQTTQKKPSPSNTQFNSNSLEMLKHVNPTLQRLLIEARNEIQFEIVPQTGGVRAEIREQLGYLRDGSSKTIVSKHFHGNAVDIIPKKGTVLSHYKEIAEIIKASGKKLGYKIRWGGDFHQFKDLPHFELVGKEYAPKPEEMIRLLRDEGISKEEVEKTIAKIKTLPYSKSLNNTVKKVLIPYLKSL